MHVSSYGLTTIYSPSGFSSSPSQSVLNSAPPGFGSHYPNPSIESVPNHNSVVASAQNVAYKYDMNALAYALIYLRICQLYQNML
jgi:hypothetical protein